MQAELGHPGAVGGVVLGEEGAGLGVGVQDRAGPAGLDQGKVQFSFGTGAAAAPQHLAPLVHHDQLFRRDGAFVDPTGGHQQLQGLPLQHAAEIATGSLTPPPAVDGGHGGDQLLRQLGAAGRGNGHGQLRLPQCWQLGHQWVLRPPSLSRRIGVWQRRQGSPPRRYTQATPP